MLPLRLLTNPHRAYNVGALHAAPVWIINGLANTGKDRSRPIQQYCHFVINLKGSIECSLFVFDT